VHDQDRIGFLAGKVEARHAKHSRSSAGRLHKRPNAYEIDRCHWWVDYERKIIRPDVIVALGATAIRSVLGRPLTINKTRGRVISLADGGHMLATIHPSYILRIEDDADKRTQYRQFVADLKVCRKFLAQAALGQAVNNFSRRIGSCRTTPG